jgi:2-iminoacetate synthase ThiH
VPPGERCDSDQEDQASRFQQRATEEPQFRGASLSGRRPAAHLIRRLGKTPVQRDMLYRDVKVWS